MRISLCDFLVFYLYVCIITDGDLTKVYKAASSLCQSFYRCNGSLDRCFSSIGSEDFIALYPLYFAMAIQWCSFKGGDGFTCSTIFSTNNLRQFTTSMTEYLCSKDPDALRKWKFFASVLLCFHFGVIVSYLSCKNFGHTGSLVCFLPVFSGFCLVWARKHFVAVKHLSTTI